jgi:hypothetical protein
MTKPTIITTSWSNFDGRNSLQNKLMVWKRWPVLNRIRDRVALIQKLRLAEAVNSEVKGVAKIKDRSRQGKWEIAVVGRVDRDWFWGLQLQFLIRLWMSKRKLNFHLFLKREKIPFHANLIENTHFCFTKFRFNQLFLCY